MKDLIIVGAGPAGLGASIYASRYKLEHSVLAEEIGGQVVEASEIENYAGYEKISGKDLMEIFKKQTVDLGGEIIQASVARVIKKEDETFKITDIEGKEYEAKSVIFALGMKARKMGVKGEDQFVGKGISYCATCDAMFFRNKDVVVIGGGDAAATAAIHVAEFAKHITLLYRDQLICEPAWVEQMNANEKIEMVACDKILEITGDGTVKGVIYEKEGQQLELAVQGVFVEVGSVPGVVVAKELGVETDEQGYIVVKPDQSTNIEGVYAAGDVTTNSNKFRQIITAVAEGAVAAGSVYKKIKLKK